MNSIPLGCRASTCYSGSNRPSQLGRELHSPWEKCSPSAWTTTADLHPAATLAPEERHRHLQVLRGPLSLAGGNAKTWIPCSSRSLRIRGGRRECRRPRRSGRSAHAVGARRWRPRPRTRSGSLREEPREDFPGRGPACHRAGGQSAEPGGEFAHALIQRIGHRPVHGRSAPQPTSSVEFEGVSLPRNPVNSTLGASRGRSQGAAHREGQESGCGSPRGQESGCGSPRGQESGCGSPRGQGSGCGSPRGQGSTSPVRYAMTVAWVRSRAPSLRSTEATWVRTVSTPRKSRSAISALVAPPATASRTSCSRVVRAGPVYPFDLARGRSSVRTASGNSRLSPWAMVRTAWTISCAPERFSRKPEAPASSASSTYPSCSKVVTTKTDRKSTRLNSSHVADRKSVV